MFDSFDAFLAMGGYGSYVWSAYAVCFVLLGLLTVQSILVWKRRQRELTLLQAGRERRRSGNNTPPKTTGADTAAGEEEAI